MSPKPLVTSVIIFLNGERYLQEAIESILNQTYDSWELMLVDDGSTDGSTAIAKQYAEHYPTKIRYLEHPGHQNRGMSASRNLGVRSGTGEYIAFLDADDIWLPHKLEEQVPLLASQPEAAMLYGRTKNWFSWAEHNPTMPEDIEGDFMTITSSQFDTLVEPQTQLLLFLQNPLVFPCTCSVLIRRQIYEEVGGFEEGFKNAHEDMVFHSKVFLRAPVYVSSTCWDFYRMHPDSYWRSAEKQGKGEETRYLGRLKYLNWLEQYLSEEKINSPAVWKALNKALWTYRYPILSKSKRLVKKLVQSFVKLIFPAPIRSWLEDYINLAIVRSSVKPISELKEITGSVNDLIVLCTVTNGELFIKPFVEHYFSLGAKHIVLLDNGSTDFTVDTASSYDDVTVLQTKYKNPAYQAAMKKYLVERFAKNRPYLVVTIDELLDSPIKEQKFNSSPVEQIH
jgi:glycosyltransferase involved in cell wall biosynthesis